MSEVLYDKFEDGYAVFTLNRPESLNAMNTALREQFTDALDDFNADPAMRVGIVTGAGRAFGAGGDLKAHSMLEEGRMDAESERAQRAFAGQFGRSPKVFIAAVNGLCIAGSFEWTLDMDIRICTPEAYFGLFEVKRGLLPGFGLHRLPRMIPFGEAMYLVLTGDRMTAEQALRCGLVHEVVSREQLIPRAIEIAQTIIANHPLGVEGARAVARHAIEKDAADTRALHAWVGRSLHERRAAVEGARAFAEKRVAVFDGNDETVQPNRKA